MKAVHRFLVLALGVILVVGLASGQITSAASGNWSATGTWVGGVVPGASDAVIIADGHTVTLDGAATPISIANLTIGQGASGLLQFNSTTAIALTITGNMVVSSGAGFDAADYTNVDNVALIHTVTISGDLSNSGSMFDCRSGSATAVPTTLAVVNFVFTGSGNSTVTMGAFSNSNNEFNSFEINKSGSGKIILGGDVVLQGGSTTQAAATTVPKLTSGIIETGSNKIISLWANNGAVTGGSASSHVNGTLGRGMSNSGATNKDFQVGDGTLYRPTRVYNLTTGTATGHYIWVKMISGDAFAASSFAGSIDKVSADRYYDVGYGVTIGGAASMDLNQFRLSYGTEDNVAAGNTDLRVAYAPSDRSTWTGIGPAGHTTAPPTTITSDVMGTAVTLTSGSHMYVALARASGTSTNPLPVQLTGFTAAADLRGTTLTWKTASEVDNAGFEVERRAIANFELSIANYAKVGFVAGAGTSTSERSYSFTDVVAPGRYAYRLKQIDRNGSSSYSGEAEAEVGLAPKSLTLGSHPNPFNPATTIDFTLPSDGVATLRVFNLLGQEVATLFAGQATAGRLYQVPFDASRLMSGAYVARLESSGQVAVTKLTVMK